MPARSSDKISAALEHLRAWSSAQRVAWVPGSLSEPHGDMPRIHFRHDSPEGGPLASAEAFARTLAALDVAMLVVSVVILDEESQLAAVGLYDEDPGLLTGPNADAERAVMNALLAEAHEARHHIGQPGSATVTAITRNPTVAIEWSETAEWYGVIEASDLAFTEMAEADVDGESEDDDDYEEWMEVEPEPPPPPPPPRRRIEPRR